MARYKLICVAPEVPSLGTTDDFDQAMLWSDAHFEVWDSETNTWHGLTCQEEEDYHSHRFRYKHPDIGGFTRLWPDPDDADLVVGGGISFKPKWFHV